MSKTDVLLYWLYLNMGLNSKQKSAQNIFFILSDCAHSDRHLVIFRKQNTVEENICVCRKAVEIYYTFKAMHCNSVWSATPQKQIHAHGAQGRGWRPTYWNMILGPVHNTIHLFFRHSKTSSSCLSADLSITCTLPSVATSFFPVSLVVMMVVFVLLVMVAVLLVRLLALSPLTSCLTRPVFWTSFPELWDETLVRWLLSRS